MTDCWDDKDHPLFHIRLYRATFQTLFFPLSVSFLFHVLSFPLYAYLNTMKKNKAMKNKAITGFKTSNALRFFFFFITAWLTKGKFLYTEEYKHIDCAYRLYIPFSADCICHVLLVGERVLTMKSVKLQRKTSNLGVFWGYFFFLNLLLFWTQIS